MTCITRLTSAQIDSFLRRCGHKILCAISCNFLTQDARGDYTVVFVMEETDFTRFMQQGSTEYKRKHFAAAEDVLRHVEDIEDGVTLNHVIVTEVTLPGCTPQFILAELDPTGREN